jgi:hypothetical protein
MNIDIGNSHALKARIEELENIIIQLKRQLFNVSRIFQEKLTYLERGSINNDNNASNNNNDTTTTSTTRNNNNNNNNKVKHVHSKRPVSASATTSSINHSNHNFAYKTSTDKINSEFLSSASGFFQTMRQEEQIETKAALANEITKLRSRNAVMENKLSKLSTALSYARAYPLISTHDTEEWQESEYESNAIWVMNELKKGMMEGPPTPNSPTTNILKRSQSAGPARSNNIIPK